MVGLVDHPDGQISVIWLDSATSQELEEAWSEHHIGNEENNGETGEYNDIDLIPWRGRLVDC